MCRFPLHNRTSTMRRLLLLLALLSCFVAITQISVNHAQLRIRRLENEIGPGRGHVARARQRHFPPIDVYTQTLPQGDQSFSAVTRFTIQQFNDLVTELRPHIESNRHVRLHVEPGERHHVAKLTVQNRLFMTLKFLTTGASCADLGQQFGLSPSAVSEEIRHTVFALVCALSHEIAWPTHEQQAQLSRLFGPRFPSTIGTLDGTFTPSWRRLGDFSGHRHTTVRHHQIACDALGYVIHIVAGQVGSRHDSYQYRRTNIGDWLEADNVDLLVDSAYSGIPHLIPPGTRASMPDRAQRIAYNLDHTAKRSRIEKFIGDIKHLFAVASNRWQRQDRKFLAVCFVACCILYNRRKRLNG